LERKHTNKKIPLVPDCHEAGELEGKQTDWGGWVARATKKQICEFMADVYVPEYSCVISESEYEELCDFVANLDDNKQYALVASEL
jgi:hypothetical protein